MQKLIERLVSSKFGWIVLLLLLLVINFLASEFHTRLDLTKEKRYTLSKATERLARSLDDDVVIEVFLKGEFPSGFRKLANSAGEFLQLLKERNGSKIQYSFISPQDKVPGTETRYADTLAAFGAVPINLTVTLSEGQSSNFIYPVALMHYKGRSSLVNLYPGASGRISQEEINSAEALMEYQFASALDKLTCVRKPTIGYAVGNGEPVDYRTEYLVRSLQEDYDFRIFDLQSLPVISDSLDVMLIVKPTIQFNEAEKFKLDQFVMNGGKLFCFIDNLIAEQDSLSGKPQTIAYDRNLNLTDLFFKYGLRINTDLIMDLQSDRIPFVVGGTMDNPQFEFLQWNYFPLLNSVSNKLNKVGYVAGRFVNSIDTINVPGIQKTVLLASSSNSRIITTPALISLNENRNAPEDAKFKQSAIPAAMLLEGKFTSLYRHRATKAQIDSMAAFGQLYKEQAAEPGQIIVVADGDLALNEIMQNPENGQPMPLPMGYNKYTFREYMEKSDYGKYFVPVANQDFLLSGMDYLVNNPDITATRNKDIVLRLLDSQKIKKNESLWKFINVALPILLVMLIGFIYQRMRRAKYR